MADATYPGTMQTPADNPQELYVTLTLPLSVVVELLDTFARKNDETRGRLAFELAKLKETMEAQMPMQGTEESHAAGAAAVTATSATNGGAAGFDEALKKTFSAFELTRKGTDPPPTF